MKRSLFGIIIVLLFANCKTERYTLNNLPQKLLIFGNGGGMSGAVTTYILLENGQLFSSNSLTGENKELGPIGKADAKNYFLQLFNIVSSEIRFDHPGNRYYFLEDRNGNDQNRIVWGSAEHEVPAECKALYQELIAHLNNDR